MTPGEAKLYEWLLARADEPRSPTIREMMAAMGTPWISTIHSQLKALERGGFVKRSGPRNREVRAVPINILATVPTEALKAEIKRRRAE